MTAEITYGDHTVDGLFVRSVTPTVQSKLGHPLVFIHGGFHGWWTWERWQRQLASLGWRTYALSLPGHTDSKPLPDGEFAVLDLADYALAVRRVLNWIGEAPILVGHSLGGGIAQMVAQDVPLKGLVLVASGRYRRGENLWGDNLPADVTPGQPITIDKEVARRRFFHLIDDEEFSQIYERLCPESPAALNDRTRGGVIDNPTFEGPVLALTAEHDLKTVNERAEYAARTYHATQAVVRDAGHDLMLDATSHDAATYLHAWLIANIPNTLPTIHLVDQGDRTPHAPGRQGRMS
jgi:pimeloyl-ACP methyl ester carboxylesterase